MLPSIVVKATDPQFIVMALAAIAAAATVLALAMPLLAADQLGKRMKAVALERSIESLCNGLRAVRRELPEQHAHNLWWVGHRVANL